VAQQHVLHVRQLQRPFEQRIVIEVDLAHRQIVGGAPVSIHPVEQLGCKCVARRFRALKATIIGVPEYYGGNFLCWSHMNVSSYRFGLRSRFRQPRGEFPAGFIGVSFEPGRARYRGQVRHQGLVTAFAIRDCRKAERIRQPPADLHQ